MKTLTITINGKEIKARPGEKILWVALENGIYIPSLCAIRDRHLPEASCRLCWVEIEGREQPVTACTEEVTGGMRVNTRGDKAVALARAAFELLMASHDLDCARCPANGRCELQKIARITGFSLKPQSLPKILPDSPPDTSHPFLTYNPKRCVLCGRCVWVCRRRCGEKAILGFARRSFARTIVIWGEPPYPEQACPSCLACARVCPTGALFLKDSAAQPE